MDDNIIFKKRQIHILASKLGYLIVILMFPVDLFMYPDFIWPLVAIRLFLCAYLMFVQKLFSTVGDEFLTPVIVISCFFVSVSVTLMCFVTGDGFASPYYAGHFIIIIILSAFYELKPKYYALIILIIVSQHFTLLWFVPWELKYLMTTLFFFGAFSIAGYIMHALLYKLINEIGILRGILPICAKCKKVRKDDGYWEQVEVYVKDRSEVEFTHGICPDCSKKIYPEIDIK